MLRRKSPTPAASKSMTAKPKTPHRAQQQDGQAEGKNARIMQRHGPRRRTIHEKPQAEAFARRGWSAFADHDGMKRRSNSPASTASSE
jgi:hypothetical protein